MKTVKPGGLLVLGEPFKLKEPDAAYVQVEPDFALGMVTHAENVSIAQQSGLDPAPRHRWQPGRLGSL
jgi:hypothetical protein